MRKLILCEKPMAANEFCKLINKNDKIILSQSIAGYTFNYQDIKFSEAPYTKENPKYKFRKLENSLFSTASFNYKKEIIDCPMLIEIYNKREILNKEEYIKLVINYLKNFNEIIFACDWDISGHRGFHLKFSNYFKLGENWLNILTNLGIKITAVKISCFNHESLKKDFNNRVEYKNNENIEYFKDSYIKKDYFEYNYNLNSLLFFNEILKNLNSNLDILLTKNYISTLFLINNNEKNEHEILSEMREMAIGSFTSKSKIISKLFENKLIENDKNNHLILTDLSEKFIKFLHKKINDPYLNIRLYINNLESSHYDEKLIALNQNLSVDDFKFKYEKYLYDVFSKQKRLSRKNFNK